MAFSCVCALSIADTAVRTLIAVRDGQQRAIRLREHAPFFTGHFSPPEGLAPEESSEGGACLLRTDADGFILPSRVHEKADVRVVFLGGSTTECRFLQEKTRFPYLVGRLIDEKCSLSCNTYNGARAGNHSLHSLDLLLHKIVPLRPEFAVLMHNINDLTTLLYEKSYWNDLSTRSLLIDSTGYPPRRGFLRQVYPGLGRALNSLALRISSGFRGVDEWVDHPDDLSVDRQWIASEFSKPLRLFIEACRSYGITPVLMTQANRLNEAPDREIADAVEKRFQGTGISYAEFRKLHELFNSKIREVGREHQVLVIDLAREIPAEARYMYDLVHFTDEGSRLAASIIAKHLSKAVLESNDPSQAQ